MSQPTALSPGGYVRQGQRGASPPRSVNVQVAVRCRPLNERERTHAERPILSCDEDRREVVFSGVPQTRKAPASSSSSMTSGVNGKRTFTYDHVFDPHASQADVYDRLIQPIVDEVLQGYNCTVFAYGQTGTGKTHTMEGRRHDDVLTAEDRRLPCNAGIIPRAINQIFNHLRCLTDEHSVRVSHLELYNEQLTDLLSPEDAELRVYEDSHKGTFVQGLEDTVVRSEQEIFAVLDKSAVKRKTAETNMNKYSSRSHSIFSITIHIKESTPEGADLLRSGKLNLVDLAGSENVGRSGAVKGRAREAGNINQSLLTLGRVITALVDRHPHVPYRDSKLTRILQESLGGRNKTCIIATVTPASGSLEETLSTLDYAYRAKSIKNRPTVNQMIAKHVLLKEYSDEIAKLKRELDATREKNGVYLSPEEFDRLTRENSSKASQISSLETQTEEFEKKIASVQQTLERTQTAWHRDQKLLKETSDKLIQVRKDYRQTKHDLRVTTQQRDENGLLVKQHVGTERALTAQGIHLQSTLSESLKDVTALHTRVDVKTENEKENIVMLNNLKRDVTDKISTVCSFLDGEVSSQGQMTTKTKARLGQLRAVMESALAGIGERFSQMRQNFEEQEVSDTKKNNELHNNFETKVQTLLTETETSLSEQRGSHQAAHERIKTLTKEMTGVLNNALASVDAVLVTVNDQTTHINKTLKDLSNLHATTLDDVQNSISVHAAKQCDLVAQLSANGQRAAQAQDGELRASSAKMMETLSGMMKELIEGCASKRVEQTKEDERLYSLLKTSGEETTQEVKTLCGKSTSDTSQGVTTCLSHTDTIHTSLKTHRDELATQLLNDDDVSSIENTNNNTDDDAEHQLRGNKLLSGINTASTTAVERMSNAHTVCDSSLQAIRSEVHTQGEEMREEMNGQKQMRNICLGDMYDDTIQKSRAASDELKNVHSDIDRMMDENAHHLVSHTVDGVKLHLTDGLQSCIDQACVRVDEQAVDIPPRRQWQLLDGPLARTRNHESLIQEMRRRQGGDGTANECEAMVDDDNDDDDGDDDDGSKNNNNIINNDANVTGRRRRRCEDEGDDDEVNVDVDAVTIEDFGHDVERTPQSKRSTTTTTIEVDNNTDTNNTIITNSADDTTAAADSVDKNNNNDDDVVIVDENDFKKEHNNTENDDTQDHLKPDDKPDHHRATVSPSRRKPKAQRRQQQQDGALSEAESTASARTEDDVLAHNNSSDSAKSKEVLVDVSNRRAATTTTSTLSTTSTTGRRSVRRIEPVIKKASGIPAPRRATRRLAAVQQQQQQGGSGSSGGTH